MYLNKHIDGLVQYCGNSSALALELLQPCAKHLTYIAIILEIEMSEIFLYSLMNKHSIYYNMYSLANYRVMFES